MNFRFSELADTLKSSEIREILKLTELPDIISFAGGLPAPELFPIDDIAVLTQEILKNDGKAALQYSPTEGYPLLREIIASERMLLAGVKTSIDQILITAGSQQGIDFCAHMFLDRDDYIICERPTYLGALNAFNAHHPKYIDIPMDDNGMIMEELEKALIKCPNAKMIYTVPDFQNPTGKTMSVERRKRLVELSAQYKILVIEDNPYGELIFEGERLPSIKSFDKEGWVIYLGSFSKTFCPGYRIGWICAHEILINKFVMLKQLTDLQCSSIAQREIALYMQKHKLDEHIKKIVEVYKKRRDVMLENIAAYFPPEIKYTFPAGGLFTWVELKPELDAAMLLEVALQEKVAFVPGSSFFAAKGNYKNYLRLNYSNMPEEKIVEGIQRLGKVLYRYY